MADTGRQVGVDFSRGVVECLVVRPRDMFMTRIEKESWEKTRAQGYDWFILRAGLLRRGLPFGFFVTIFWLLTDYYSGRPVDPLLTIAAEFGVLTLVYGFLTGNRIWNDNENDFKKDIDVGEVAASATESKEAAGEVDGGGQCVACGKGIAARTKYCPFCGWTQPREFYEPVG